MRGSKNKAVSGVIAEGVLHKPEGRLDLSRKGDAPKREWTTASFGEYDPAHKRGQKP
jgi:hypothetical protein